ncbi:MAG: PIN domain-containing protein [Methylovulum sp.]
MAKFSVIYDACVLYPAPVRDLLMQLALTDLFKARWTDQIHDEWIEALLRRDKYDRKILERTRDLMDASVRDAKVSGYEELINALVLPDPEDRHVLAAAIKAGANAIVTFNLKDFPGDVLSIYGIEAIHPDEFVYSQIDLVVRQFCFA